MNTITDKLNYLSETKDLFKKRLTSLGAEITNQTTFRNYLNWVKNLYGEVSNKTRLAREGIEGNTYQETTTGKNLANYNDNINNSVPNLTITTDSDSYIIVNGTKNVGYPIIVNQIEITDILEDGETYTIWQEDITASGTSGFSKCENRIRAINTQGQYSNVRTLGKHTNRLVVDKTTFPRYFVDVVLPNNAETYNNYKNRFMLLKGSYTDSDLIEYEPYTNGASPNPDYPQKIVNISGKSTLKDVGKNLFDKNNANIIHAFINNSVITTAADTGGFFYIPCEPNTTYTVSKTEIFGNDRFCVFDTYRIPTKGDIVLSYVGKPIGSNSDTSLTITTNTTATYLGIFIKAGETSPAKTFQEIADTIQLEKGSTASDYEPYQEQSFDLDLKSKNLFDKDNVKGSYDANATLMTIQLQPNTQYTFSRIVNTTFARDNGYYLYFVKNEDTSTRIFDLMHLSMTDPITSGTETITTGASGIIKLIGVYAYPERVQNYFNNVNVQIEEGSTATDYEPYYDINLCKIENYKDRIYPLNGKWYLEKKIGKVVLTGDSSESYSLSSNTNVIYYQSAINVGNSSNILSNYYFYSSFINLYNATVDYAISYNTSNNLLAIRNKNMSSANDFKTWLSTHNTIVYYPLETPTTEEITESNYPTLYNQLNSIQDYLIKYKINKEFMLEYSEPTIEIESEEN